MTPARTRTRLTPELRRAQIIQAATGLIAARGFNTLTLSRLAAEAGLTRAGIEHHFASKEEVLIAVLRHRDQLDSEAVTDPIGPPPHDFDTTRSLLAALMRRNAGQREIVRLYTILGAEALDPTHPAHDYFVERFAAVRELLTTSARGWADDPDLFAIETLGRMDGLQLQWLRDPSLDLEQLWLDGYDALTSRTTASSRPARE